MSITRKSVRAWTAMGTVLLLGSVLGSVATPVQADEPAASSWPQFLGPTRDGISRETGLIDAIPKDGPPVVWRTPGGVGMSGLAIAEKRVVTLVQKDGRQTAIALDALTGKPLWETPLAPEYRNSMGNGPRATPAVHDGRVFVFTGEGILAALKLSDGTLLWKTSLIQELKGQEAEYGMACSPLVVGETVMVTVGAPRATVAACDVKTGELVWTGGNDSAGYSSLALRNVGGREQVVAFTGRSAIGLSPTKGELLWRYGFTTPFDCNIATPIAWKEKLFLSSGENHGCVLLSFAAKGDDAEVREEWKSFGPDSVMRNEWQTSLLQDGYLYGFDNVGGAGPVTHLNCVEIATGKRVWQKPRFGKGNAILADGKLFISTMKGELVLVKATPEKFVELGRAELLGSTRQAPALADGRLYLRDDETILCIDVRAKK